MQKKSNHLIHENSPYLIQHAYNPVEWYPWGDEALEKAKKENKMLIISVGYSACHWCHVMEHESYEDSLVASIMNEHFVNIKVDREERPDIDDIYMSACQLSNGKNCGWPLNAFALPDGRPVWAGTYFPKTQWINILKQFISYQKEDAERLEEAAVNLLIGMQNLDQLVANHDQAEINESLVHELHDILIKQIDPQKGGRKGAPKFPLPNNYKFLLQHYDIYRLPETLEAIETTLDNMAYGGIYDQIGGGFARYSTDADWFAPHFEKMLYDNAQLISLYSQAYQLTKNEEYREVIDQSIEFVKRELSHLDGPFYSALDADSEGVEGKYYVWTASEIEQLIQNKNDQQIILDYFNINKRGNWEHGNNILYRNENKRTFAEKNNLSLSELQLILDKNLALLLQEREKRIRPALDDKTLCSWNALMISGLVDAYKATGNKSYLELALKNAAFIKNVMLESDYSLWRSYKDGQTKINAFLDDYANTIQAFMGLYEVSFDMQWLTDAEGLTKYAIEHFYDESNYSFYYTSDLDPALITRKKELSDNVIPGSVSTMTKNLLMLGHYLSNDEFLQLSKNCFGALLPTIEKVKQPSYYSNWLSVALHLLHSPNEIVIAGENAAQFRDELMSSFLPNSILVGSTDISVLPLLENRFQNDKTLIYVCQNRVCKVPVDMVKDAKEQLLLSK